MRAVIGRGLSSLSHGKDKFQTLYQQGLGEEVRRIYPSHKIKFNDGLNLFMAKHRTKFSETDLPLIVGPSILLAFAMAYCCHGDDRKKWRYSIFQDAANQGNYKETNVDLNHKETNIDSKYIGDEIVILFDGILENEYVVPWWGFMKNYPEYSPIDKLEETLKEVDKLMKNQPDAYIDDEISIDIYEEPEPNKSRADNNCNNNNNDNNKSFLEEFEESRNK